MGDPENVNTDFIQLLFDSGITPVFCAITHDGDSLCSKSAISLLLYASLTLTSITNSNESGRIRKRVGGF